MSKIHIENIEMTFFKRILVVTGHMINFWNSANKQKKTKIALNSPKKILKYAEISLKIVLKLLRIVLKYPQKSSLDFGGW